MPSTVRCSETKLVTAIRRRESSGTWIETYLTNDDGQTWDFLSWVAPTGGNNGNPPGMVRLRDGRLCVTYGFRGVPYGIRAKISSDEGQTWSEEIILRDDGREWDLGYPRTVQRMDGNLMTIYYFTTDEHPEQFIGDTIWEVPAPTCAVDFRHFARFAEQWLDSGSGLAADLDGDNVVDLFDLSWFVDEWLYSCPHGWQLR